MINYAGATAGFDTEERKRTLIEKLLAVDREKATEKETKELRSAKLERLIGSGAKIKIKEISGRRFNDLNKMLYTSKGDRDHSKDYDYNLMICAEGIAEPSLKDALLMEHFGASTPKDLAEILFGVESASISMEIVKLSGLADEAEDDIKN